MYACPLDVFKWHTLASTNMFIYHRETFSFCTEKMLAPRRQSLENIGYSQKAQTGLSSTFKHPNAKS